MQEEFSYFCHDWNVARSSIKVSTLTKRSVFPFILPNVGKGDVDPELAGGTKYPIWPEEQRSPDICASVQYVNGFVARSLEISLATFL